MKSSKTALSERSDWNSRAKTIESSMAMLAPLAKCGVVVCAASPMTMIRPRCHGDFSIIEKTGRHVICYVARPAHGGAPDHLTSIMRLVLWTECNVTNQRIHSIRAYDQIVARGFAVCELHRHALIILRKRVGSGAQPDWNPEL